MDDATLIDLVRQYEILYNKRNPNFKNNLKKANAWNTIATVMNDTVENVEQRWTVLRNRFASERRKLKYTGSGSEATVTWQLFGAMSFLDKFVIPRKTYGNKAAPVRDESQPQSQHWDTLSYITGETGEMDDSQIDECHTIVNEETNSDDDETHTDNQLSTVLVSNKAFPAALKTGQSTSSGSRVATPSSSRSSPPSTPSTSAGSLRKRKKNVQQELSKAVTDAFSQFSTVVGEIGKDKHEEEDEDYLFCKTIAKTLNRIKSNKVKARIKIQILEILEQYED